MNILLKFWFIVIVCLCSSLKSCSKSKYVHSYESCGFSYGAFTLHEDGSVTHFNYGSNTVKGTWHAEGNKVIIEGIPDYSDKYILDGENKGVALKSLTTGRRYCSEY